MPYEIITDLIWISALTGLIGGVIGALLIIFLIIYLNKD